ncbi:MULTISPECIES: BPTD_2524 family lipoprotein [unclassified Achromobacter]|uniref:BPTD_2524 family lipoprotein n=1 Tax=unclassified Achromobacter TaxID=2626865 RepID=UPI00069E57C2|nr:MULTISPECIES: hypothetical protein [unclassified Achromobacter]KOF53477.1 hypothetical protein AD428_13240 [Achromobacter sp. DMS1]
MYRNLVAASALALGLAGCSIGISQDSHSPRAEFTAPVDYKDAYDTAVRQANACLRSTDNAYRVSGRLDTASQAGTVRVLAPYSDNEMALVDVKGAGPGKTAVRIVMWGKGTWDAAAVRAMSDAIVYGLTSCSSYMPLDPKPVKPSRDLPR